MNVGVVGSRGFEDYGLLQSELAKLDITRIVSGGAKGADSLAAKYAKENSIELVEYKPDYKQFGRGAPHVRNRQIVDDSNLVVAFWDGKSKGTLSTLTYADKKGVQANIVSYED